jgi:hypothetical protein
MSGARPVLAVLALLLSACGEVDACLDHGGRWDRKERKCEISKNAEQVNRCWAFGGVWQWDENRCMSLEEYGKPESDCRQDGGWWDHDEQKCELPPGVIPLGPR